ncbi:glycosyltransferase family A protein [Halalkalibacter sp. APA_J-10(15)]|uniref:glycosyltransferase family 2 protein n=1 Tax=unclassified Halalkalibacter TaxID=2893063 RepID=UPI001FF63B7F|nr:glycosyltransferase family A protein [Halalkalibacter sp. APA_J-10(15)]MCK0470354.1 glycosyltransferase family 2 protein [Halalkalibacter sp. APA_J-10(15)]
MDALLTVFTPTYNRAYILHECYESLKRQTSGEFVWLIIDDGSTDETAELVREWIQEEAMTICYHYQENQGMHGAHNTAYKLIQTELNVCLDSDDYFADDAVEKITSFWRQFGHGHYAGIVALDAYPSGEIVGTALPHSMKAATLSDLYMRYNVKGDKKLIYRTEFTSKTPPYPIYEGETYCPLSYKYILIDQICPLLIMDEVVCYVEYLNDGSSLNMVQQYRKNPRGFSFFRKVAMKYAPTWDECLREAIHYVSSNLFIRNHRFLIESPCKWTTLFAIPFGFMLHLYIRFTRRQTVMK